MRLSCPTEKVHGSTRGVLSTSMYLVCSRAAHPPDRWRRRLRRWRWLRRWWWLRWRRWPPLSQPEPEPTALPQPQPEQVPVSLSFPPQPLPLPPPRLPLPLALPRPQRPQPQQEPGALQEPGPQPLQEPGQGGVSAAGGRRRRVMRAGG